MPKVLEIGEQDIERDVTSLSKRLIKRLKKAKGLLEKAKILARGFKQILDSENQDDVVLIGKFNEFLREEMPNNNQIEEMFKDIVIYLRNRRGERAWPELQRKVENYWWQISQYNQHSLLGRAVM